MAPWGNETRPTLVHFQGSGRREALFLRWPLVGEEGGVARQARAPGSASYSGVSKVADRPSTLEETSTEPDCPLQV